MDNQIKVLSFQYVANHQVQTHSQQELQHLVHRHVLPAECIEYNKLLSDFIAEEGGNSKRNKGDGKAMELDKNIADVDRIQIINNGFKNRAELMLKVPAVAQMGDKQVKAILDWRKASHD